MSKGKPTTLVIGAGLIGTSIAMGLVKAGYTLFIDDTDPHAIDIATTVYKNRADSIFPMALPAVTSSAENCSTSTAENSGASAWAAVASWEA